MIVYDGVFSFTVGGGPCICGYLPTKNIIPPTKAGPRNSPFFIPLRYPPQNPGFGRWLMPVNGFFPPRKSSRLPKNAQYNAHRKPLYGSGPKLHEIQDRGSPDCQSGHVQDSEKYGRDPLPWNCPLRGKPVPEPAGSPRAARVGHPGCRLAVPSRPRAGTIPNLILPRASGSRELPVSLPYPMIPSHAQ